MFIFFFLRDVTLFVFNIVLLCYFNLLLSSALLKSLPIWFSIYQTLIQMIIFDRCDSNSIIYLYIAYIKLYCKTPVKFKQKYILEHKRLKKSKSIQFRGIIRLLSIENNSQYKKYIHLTLNVKGYQSKFPRFVLSEF